MGILDSLSGLLGGSGRTTQAVELAPGEVERARVVASWSPGGLRSVGGDLVLTDRRLVFTPLDVADLVNAVSWGLGKAGGPVGIDGIPGSLEKMIAQHSISDPQSVRAGRDAGVTSPPTVIVQGADGSSHEIGVLASRMSPNLSSRNARARDAFVATVRAELTR